MAAQRSVFVDVLVSLGLLTVKVDGLSTKKSEASNGSSFNMICMACETPTKLNQGYSCEHGHGPYTVGEVTRRAKEVDGKLVEVSAAQIAAAKTTDVETKLFAISVFDAEAVEAHTLPGELSYRLRPAKKATSTEGRVYALFTMLAADPTKALIGEFNVKGSTKLARLTVFRDQLCLQTLVRPSDIADSDELDVSAPTDAELTMGQRLIEGVTEEFNPENYRDVVRERLAALTADPDAPVTALPTPAAKAEGDLMAMLEASIAAKKVA